MQSVNVGAIGHELEWRYDVDGKREVAIWIGTVGGIVASAVLLGFVKSFRKAFVLQFQKAIKRWTKTISARHIKKHLKIQAILGELLADTGADRSYVFRFHNGQEFSPSHPIWRMSCTHEHCRPGVAYNGSKWQGTLVSSVISRVAPLITGESGDPAIVRISCSVCTDCDRVVLMYTVAELGDHRLRADLLAGGNKQMICGALLSRAGNVIGFIGVDYLNEKAPPDEELVLTVCKTAMAIETILKERE